MADKPMTSTQTVASGDAGSAGKRARHSVNPPPVNLRELEETHESCASASATARKVQETPEGLRMRAALSGEIGRPVPRE